MVKEKPEDELEWKMRGRMSEAQKRKVEKWLSGGGENEWGEGEERRFYEM